MIQTKAYGRPQYVYSRKGTPKKKDLAHAVMCLEIELRMKRRVELGVRFGNTVCDGLLIINGVRYHLEADYSGKECRKQWLCDKIDKYPDQGGSPREFVLVVAMSQARMGRLIEWTRGTPAAGYTLFATLAGLGTWIDCTGRTVKL